MAARAEMHIVAILWVVQLRAESDRRVLDSKKMLR